MTGEAPSLIPAPVLRWNQRVRLHVGYTAWLHGVMPQTRGNATTREVVIVHDPGKPECPQHDTFQPTATCLCDPKGRYMLAYLRRGLPINGDSIGAAMDYFSPFYTCNGPGGAFIEPGPWIIEMLQACDTWSENYTGQFSDDRFEYNDGVMAARRRTLQEQMVEGVREIKDRYGKERREAGLTAGPARRLSHRFWGGAA